MRQTSRIELSASALKGNIRYLKRRFGRGVTFTSVVKSNAYGHGLTIFVRLAEDCGVRSFAVFSAAEALEVVRARCKRSDVLIMGAIDDSELEWAVEKGVAFYIFDLGRLEHAQEAARRVGKPARVHLELETGLHRLGLEPVELEGAAELIAKDRSCFIVEGVCTHYAGADSISNYLRIQRQIEDFKERCAWLEGQGITPKRRHTACSAAALCYPETVMDMVRIGIAQYGYWPSKEVWMQVSLESEGKRLRRDPLRRVISWKSDVMALKKVKPGKFIGYGTSYLTNRTTQVALVPVGYGSGFTRRLSNTGRVMIRGQRLPVVGMVNMNVMMVDVTNVAGVSVGDEVVLIGKQKKREISVSSFSELSQFLNYEVLVQLPREIPRLVVEAS